MMSVSKTYSWWQHATFWFLWSLLLLPAYAAASGSWLIGSMLPGFHEPIDIILTVIFFVTVVLIMAVAVFTVWHFVQHSRPYSRLMLWLMIGVLIIPLLSTMGALAFYVQLNDITIALK